jgi:protoheme ferro-lyase
MTYGQPGIDTVLKDAEHKLYDHIILFPLFPQYSATSTAPLYDAIAQWLLKQRIYTWFKFYSRLLSASFIYKSTCQ